LWRLRLAALLLVAACSHRPLALPELEGGATDAGGVPSLDDLARLCALAASCQQRDSGMATLSASQCTSQLLNSWPEDAVTARLVDCAGARDCASLYSCFGGNLILLGAFLPGAVCDGSAMVSSGLRFDCAQLGLTCIHEAPPIGDRAACASSACDPAAASICDGNVLDVCQSGVLVPEDCDAFGAVCGSGAPGQLGDQCNGGGASCDPVRTEGSCSGSVAANCLNGRLTAHDCSHERLRTECVMGQCIYPMTGVVPECLIGNSMCAGDSLVLCAGARGGGWKTVDCKSLGFATCARVTETQEALCN
jgi:hypothetical protein